VIALALRLALALSMLCIGVEQAHAADAPAL
jgi:hypothetical protein